MWIRDLCDEWLLQATGEHDRSLYELSYPALFEHYYRFWSARREREEWWAREDVTKRRALVCDRLEYVDSCFADAGFDLSGTEVVLFVGQGTTNGHAFRDQGRFIVWVPVETYRTSCFCDVFLSHEIIHALHYTRASDWYFNGAHDRHLVSRLLITEGIATFLTQMIIGVSEAEALWADFLSGRELYHWMVECERRTPSIAATLQAHFDESIPDWGPFCLDQLDDVLKSRGAYLVGSRLIRTVVHKHSFTAQDLLRMSRNDLTAEIRSELDASAVLDQTTPIRPSAR